MSDKPVPNWAKTVFLKYCTRILCMCRCAPEKKPEDDIEESNMPSPTKPKERERSGSTTVVSRRNSRRESSIEYMPLTRSRSQDTTQRRSLAVPGTERRGSLFRDISPGRYSVQYSDARFFGIKEPEKKEEKPKPKPNYAKDWAHVAAVFDRLFFWMCLVFIVMTTLILFHPITTMKLFKIPALESDKNKEGT